MMQKLVDRFMERKSKIVSALSVKQPDDYIDLVKIVINAITDNDYDYDAPEPDPDRIHQIDDGDYQGTLLFVIASKGYQPDVYWYVKVDYGSCSGCDTLQAISNYSDEPPTESQISDYMTLALHIVQGLKVMD